MSVGAGCWWNLSCLHDVDWWPCCRRTDILLPCKLSCWLAVWPTWNGLCEHYLNNWRVNASLATTSRSFHLLSGENRRSNVPAVGSHAWRSDQDRLMYGSLKPTHHLHCTPAPPLMYHFNVSLSVFQSNFKDFLEEACDARTRQKRATFINRMFVLRPMRIRCQQVLDPSRSSDSKRKSHGKARRRRWWVTSLVDALVKGLQQTADNFCLKTARSVDAYPPMLIRDTQPWSRLVMSREWFDSNWFDTIHWHCAMTLRIDDAFVKSDEKNKVATACGDYVFHINK